MGIPLEPKPRRFSGPLPKLLLSIGLILALLWWQKETVLSEFNRLLPQSSAVLQQLIPSVAEAQPTNEVQLVHTAVVDTETEAFTADLYLEDSSHAGAAEWIGINGRTSVQTYTVQTGDTVWGIAAEFGLELDTLRWSNPALERSPDLLLPGTELIILPVNGAYHVVSEDETLESIAAQYGVAEADIVNYPLNSLLPPYEIDIGNKLVVPNGQKDVILSKPDLAPDSPLAWPLVGRTTQAFTARHQGIDIGTVYGAEVYAAREGTVVYANWAQTGYGFTVVIDHGDNFRTLYSHLKGTWVKQGQQVNRGELIGEVGSTGNSTGPHIHFEVWQNEQRVNPLAFLE